MINAGCMNMSAMTDSILMKHIAYFVLADKRLPSFSSPGGSIINRDESVRVIPM